MFSDVATVAVLVWDSKKAAKWYREKLGFEVSEQGHWVTAQLPGSSTALHLCGECEEWGDERPGGPTGILLRTVDKEKTYRELKSKGVEFAVELTDSPWGGGKYAIFRDLDGNTFSM